MLRGGGRRISCIVYLLTIYDRTCFLGWWWWWWWWWTMMMSIVIMTISRQPIHTKRCHRLKGAGGHANTHTYGPTRHLSAAMVSPSTLYCCGGIITKYYSSGKRRLPEYPPSLSLSWKHLSIWRGKEDLRNVNTRVVRVRDEGWPEATYAIQARPSHAASHRILFTLAINPFRTWKTCPTLISSALSPNSLDQ